MNVMNTNTNIVTLALASCSLSGKASLCLGHDVRDARVRRRLQTDLRATHNDPRDPRSVVGRNLIDTDPHAPLSLTS